MRSNGLQLGIVQAPVQWAQWSPIGVHLDPIWTPFGPQIGPFGSIGEVQIDPRPDPRDGMIMTPAKWA